MGHEYNKHQRFTLQKSGRLSPIQRTRTNSTHTYTYTKFLILFLFITLHTAITHAQQIPNFYPEIFQQNISDLNNENRRTELFEIKDFYKLTPWHFAPGLSYDLITQRYYFTVSTSGLVDYFQNKKQQKRRISAIERKYKTKNSTDENRINNKILSIQANYQDIILGKKATQIEIDIFKIQKEQYQKNEINTENFLTAKKNIINTVKNHNSTVTALYNKIIELATECNTAAVDINLSDLYFSLDFIDEQ
jgi:hypothetical protein